MYADDDPIVGWLLSSMRMGTEIKVQFIRSWDRPLHMVSRGTFVQANTTHFTWMDANGVRRTVPCEQIVSVSLVGMGDIISD